MRTFSIDTDNNITAHADVPADAAKLETFASAMDVLWRPRPGGRPQFFVLEFSANQSANPAPPGRLLRFDTAEAQVAGTFITPVSMVFDETTSELFILELRGQIQRLKIN